MKNAFVFAAAAVSACAAFADVGIIDLKRGVTVPEVTAVPKAISRIEAFTDTENATLTVKQLRGIVDVPYLDHFTNDGSVVEWKITEGTTFTDVDEVFSGPFVTYSGVSFIYHTDKTVTSPAYFVNANALEWYRTGVEIEGVIGTGPCVYYSFATNALYLASVESHPAKWTVLGRPKRHEYFPAMFVPRTEGYYYGPAIVSKSYFSDTGTVDVSDSTVSGYAVTNSVVRDKVDYGIDCAMNGPEDGRSNLFIVVTHAYSGRTERSYRYSDRAGDGSTNLPPVEAQISLVETWNQTTVVGDEELSTNRYWIAKEDDPGSMPGLAPDKVNIDRHFYGTNRLLVSNDVGVVVSVVTNLMNEVGSRSKYGDILFAGVDMPTNLVSAADGTTVPVSFVPGHVVTNFAVWSTCSAQATNLLWSASPARGTITSTNFEGRAGYLLPGDRILTEGTALPTGQVKLFTSDGK